MPTRCRSAGSARLTKSPTCSSSCSVPSRATWSAQWCSSTAAATPPPAATTGRWAASAEVGEVGEQELIELRGVGFGDPVRRPLQYLEAIRAGDVVGRPFDAVATEGGVFGAPHEHRRHLDVPHAALVEVEGAVPVQR